MITITYKDKTYKEVLPRYFEDDIKTWIVKGFLEEVKENKELMDDDTLEAIKEFEEYKKSVDDSSILEKLREEIKCTIAWYDNAWHEPDRTVREVCRQFLTSLETKEQPPVVKEEKPELDINHRIDLSVDLDKTQESAQRMAQLSQEWQPTPGEMIEVSNDGEKWEKRAFDSKGENSYTWCISKDEDLWKYEGHDRILRTPFKYARQPQEWNPKYGELIEVKRNNEDWVKRIFVAKNGTNFIVESPEQEGLATKVERYDFARPITEEVIVPEVPEWDKGISGLSDRRIHELMDAQIADLTKSCQAITQWIHSQSNK